MKKLFTAAMIAVFAAMTATTFTGCSPYDDGDLRRELEEVQKQLDDQKDRLAALEALTKQLGDRLDAAAVITGITALPNGAGWRIAFSKGDPIEILNGAKGDKGDTGATGSSGSGGGKIADIVDNGNGTVTIKLAGGGEFTFTKFIPAEPDPKYFGTWEYVDYYDDWYRVTITADKLVFLDWEGDGYTIDNLTWMAIDEPDGDTDYPTGYKFSGTLTAKSYYNLPKADESGDDAAIGDIAADWLYIKASDKGALKFGNSYGDHAVGSVEYVRQPVAPDPDYFGTWKVVVGDAVWNVTVTADRLVYENSETGSYTLEDLKWTVYYEPTGAPYCPKGYKLSGELTAADNWYLNTYPLPKADGSGDAALNDIAADWYYIRAWDKGALIRGAYGDHHAEDNYEYVKQP